MRTLMLRKPPGLALAAAARFYAGFVPGSGMANVDDERLTLAFLLDGSFEAVAVELREEPEHLLAEVSGSDDLPAVERQVSRMLGLDADAAAWLELGQREPVVGKLQREFPGFFTAAKPSPYDAAAWGVLSPRLSMEAASKLKQAIARRHGQAIETARGTLHVFPAPARLLELEAIDGLPSVKLERLQGVARSALDGRLDVERLRSMSIEQALADLQQLPGVGPWTASHILFRGAALIDGLPTAEPRVRHGLADAYGIPVPTTETLERLAEGWRPFRTWVCVLLARHLAAIGGWNLPELSRQRAAAGRRLANATARLHD